MAPATSFSSSSLLPRGTYDVFLSFRGEDTRKSFTDHLYVALCQKGINTFRDDEKLKRGKSIKSELLTTIEESRFAIIILSTNYASSTWCLDELAKIVECKKQKSMIVYPVFYHVNPSDVCHQRGSFAQALEEREEDFKGSTEKMLGWRDALKEVGNLSGWHLHDSHESKIIIEIVREIFGQLSFLCPNISTKLVGIASRVGVILNLYKDLKVDDICLLGIYGMRGIGKTTLARAVYERISCEFEASVFLADVREKAKTIGLISLQKQLISKILLERGIEIQDVWEGANMIQKRLYDKKVLIILDDVDELEQLNALAQTRDWFGLGSKIIVTTRNKRLLIEHDVSEDELYEAKALDYLEALQLFSMKAFKEEHPPKGFIELSNEFVNYAKGHPLALEVLGSSLYRREDVNLWRSMLNKVKKIGDSKIQALLRVSYDELSEMQKEVFLDIACFFKGEKKDYTRDMLKLYGYEPDIIIEDLIDRSLLKIEGNRLWMHDLLEEMGQKIECSKGPNHRSRLWLSEEIHHVLKNHVGTKRVQGIVLKFASLEELHLNHGAFLKVENLKLLKVYNVHLSQGLSYLPDKLQVIEWPGYPLKSLPKGFRPHNLVQLIMPHSCIRSIWKKKKSLYELKILDLRASENLIKTPDFSGLPNLEKLILEGCVKLSKVHPSIVNLKQLILLNLRDCKSLGGLPCEISLYSLEILILSGCLKIKKFPQIVGNMKKLSELYLDRTAIEDLPLSMERLTGLTLLNLQNCKGLLTPPRVLASLTSVKNVNLSGSPIFDKMPKNQRDVEGVEELDVRGTAVRKERSCGFKWQLLTSRFFSHRSLSNPDIGLVLPTLFSSLYSLTDLNLSDCNVSNGEILSHLCGLTSLKELNLNRNMFEYIPDCISQLSKLKRVFLDDCSRLQSLPKFAPSVQFVSRCSGKIQRYRLTLVKTDEIGGYLLCGSWSGVQGVRVTNDNNGELPWMQVGFHLLRRIGYCTLPADGIPMLFNNMTNGCFVKLLLNEVSDDRSNCLGCALYFEYDGCVCSQDSNFYSTHRYKGTAADFFLHFDTDEGSLKEPPCFSDFQRRLQHGRRRFVVYIPRIWFVEKSNNVDRWTYINASITSVCPSTKIHMCGGLVIYKRNAKTLSKGLWLMSPF